MSRTVAVPGEWPKSMLGMYLISPPGVTVLATCVAPKQTGFAAWFGVLQPKGGALVVGDGGFALASAPPFFFYCFRCHVGAQN